MIIKMKDKKYNFITIFDDKTGFYARSNVLDNNQKETNEEPFMAEFPHLIDVGIMGHCIHGEKGLCAKAGIGCYQSGLTKKEPNMSISDFKELVKQCSGRVHQFALGGRGDPDQHENFEEILKLCRENNIIPNFTTSGFGLTDEKVGLCKKYCGAVAVSWYRSSYTINAIEKLIKAKVKTNIHYVVGNNTIDELLTRLKERSFPKGINAIILLLHKPAGLGQENNVLNYNDDRVKELFSLIDKEKFPFKIGMDSCTVPGVINQCTTINLNSLDTCEGARFSCYIGADMTMVPCSFDQEKRYEVSLKENTIEEAWNSDAFNRFRNILNKSCPNCTKRKHCMGGCPLMPQVVLCKDKH